MIIFNYKKKEPIVKLFLITFLIIFLIKVFIKGPDFYEIGFFLSSILVLLVAILSFIKRSSYLLLTAFLSLFTSNFIYIFNNTVFKYLQKESLFFNLLFVFLLFLFLLNLENKEYIKIPIKYTNFISIFNVKNYKIYFIFLKFFIFIIFIYIFYNLDIKNEYDHIAEIEIHKFIYILFTYIFEASCIAIIIPLSLLSRNWYSVLLTNGLLIMNMSEFVAKYASMFEIKKNTNYEMFWFIGIAFTALSQLFFNEGKQEKIEKRWINYISVRSIPPLCILIISFPMSVFFLKLRNPTETNMFTQVTPNFFNFTSFIDPIDSIIFVTFSYIILNILSNILSNKITKIPEMISIPNNNEYKNFFQNEGNIFLTIPENKMLLLEFKKFTLKYNELTNESNSIMNKLILETKNAAVARTTQMLAHDVRKPFTMLETAIDMISSTNNPNEIYKISRALIPDIRRSLSSVNGLIQDVMEIGSTSNQIELEPVNPDALIEITLREVFQLFPKSEIKLSYDLQHTYMINANIQKVGRVFSNIITNSIEAMKYKGNIWFKTSDVIDTIKFCIGNSGSFIPKENIPKLFDDFFTSGKKEGTGLGLAIAQKVVVAHGGKIWCESSKTNEDPDGKVEFFFTLPIAEGYPRKIKLHLPTHGSEIINNIIELSKNENTFSDIFITNNEAELENEIYEVCKKLGRALNILIVDDESIYRIALIKYLSKISKSYITLSEANNSSNALSLLDKMSFDLIITDIDMGHESLDGFELVQELRNFRQVESLICIHSNRLITADQNPVLDSGTDAFIPKPIARGQLLKLILRAAEKRINLSCQNSNIEKINNSPLLTTKDNSNNSDLIISIIDDEEIVLNNWRFYLGEKNVFYFTHPDNFTLAFSDDPNVKKTNLIITDYYFNNSPVTKLLDIKMLKHVLKFNGKIFLFSNVGNIDLESSFFDYIFPEKTNYPRKEQLKSILEKI